MERFWNKVKKTETCWLWIGSENGRGYGEIRFGKKKVYAHRWSYENAKGPIPDGYQIDHLCRVPACIRPAHLEAVPPKINVQRGLAAQPKPHLMKEYCSNGHKYSENTYRRKDGKGRNCEECVRVRAREYQRRKRLS